jgi:hypothetical protein
MMTPSEQAWPAVICLGELLVDLVALGPDDSIESATAFRKAAPGS